MFARPRVTFVAEDLERETGGRDTYFRCSNVFPLDKKNFSEPEYNKGFDSSENQAENYKDDVLYKLWKAITPKLHCKFSLSDLD